MERLIINVETNWLRVMLFGFCNLILSIMVLFLFFEIIIKPSKIQELWIVGVIMLGIATLIWNHIIFEISGKVNFLFDKNIIEVESQNTLFRNHIRISRQKFISISYVKNEDLFLRTYGFSSGDILLKFHGGQRRFGKGLDENASTQLILKLKNHLTENIT